MSAYLEEVIDTSASMDAVDPIQARKALGAYYTPDDLTSILSNWAIQSPTDYVFEPSFGGCGFLEAAVRRLTYLGCKLPHNQLFGCDVDPQAFDYLAQKLGVPKNIDRRFIREDFMKVFPNQFHEQEFDTVIGNPPYISRHNLSPSQLESVEQWRSQTKSSLNKRASLWAYFVIHSMSFLRRGGRMAWVLPGSFLQSTYGTEMHQLLLSKFGQVTAIELGERAFLSVGTEERTVILLCSNFGQTSASIEIYYCGSIEDLATRIEQASQETTHVHPEIEADVTQKNIIYENIARANNVVELGALCTVLIGTVTGANHFFILSAEQVKKWKLPKKCLNPILSKFSHVSGIQLTSDDVKRLHSEGKKSIIFSISPNKDVPEEAIPYTETFPVSLRERNRTFQKRQNRWLASDDGRIPDAFFSYMTHDGPRIALNSARVNSTNSIHRVYFKPAITEPQRKLTAISICTTYSQLSAEIEGRSYGSGVLKIEPSEAKKIKLILPQDKTEVEINSCFSALDECFRTQSWNKARALADAFIFGNTPEAQDQVIEPLAELLDIYRKRRQR